MTQENTWFSLNKTLALNTLKKIIYSIEDNDYNCRLVESFAFKKENELIEKKFSKSVPLIAFEMVPNQCYYILAKDEWFLWGNKPEHYFFGFEQSLKLSFLKYPTVKGNLVLCDDLINVLCLLQIGVPTILVDPITVWNNTYFNEVITPSFKNVIITFNKRFVAKTHAMQKIKFFDLKNDVVYSDFRTDIWVAGEESILESITSLYEYDDFSDNLETQSFDSTNISIHH